MPAPVHRFGEFVLDAANRSLLRRGEPVALNARYFDALVLLVCECDRLVGKQRFFDEVWAGSVVTDAALTQCIKEIRRALGDDAGSPRFVRTVAGHGYRFIAEVESVDGFALDAAVEPMRDAGPGARSVDRTDAAPVDSTNTRRAAAQSAWWADGVAATAGGALAGLMGGLLYGSVLASAPQGQGLGALSVLLVLLAIHLVVGALGAAGVGFGMALGVRFGERAAARMLGAALGGFVVGGVAKLLGSDAFTLLVGRAPSGITGGLEGAAIGFALAVGLQLGGGLDAPRGNRPVLAAAASTGLVCALLALAGGRLMASSLAAVSGAFDASRLDVGALGALLGDPRLGTPVQTALGALEGAVFGGCVAAAMLAGRRRLRSRSSD